MVANVYIVGLTGGIGSGKSTVADLFAKAGAAVVDTDAIAHALTTPGGRAIADIRAFMGEEYISSDGSLNRASTRGRVFADANVKRKLETLLHPLIQEEVEIALHSEAAQRAPYTMLVVPLFFETLAYRTCAHRTLLVDCPVGSQMERVKRRPGLDALDARRIIDAQLPRTIRLQLADDLIWNGKMVETLVPQVGELHSRYLCVAAKAA